MHVICRCIKITFKCLLHIKCLASGESFWNTVRFKNIKVYWKQHIWLFYCWLHWLVRKRIYRSSTLTHGRLYQERIRVVLIFFVLVFRIQTSSLINEIHCKYLTINKPTAVNFFKSISFTKKKNVDNFSINKLSTCKLCFPLAVVNAT